MTDRITDERLAEIGAFKHIPGELIFEVFMYLVNEREHSRKLEDVRTEVERWHDGESVSSDAIVRISQILEVQ